MNAVAENLKTLRTAARLTRDELAERLSVTRQTVAAWETGRIEPDLDELPLIAEALGADVSALIYGPKEASYPAMRKRRLAACIVLAAVILAAVLCRALLEPRLLAEKARTFDPLPYMFYLFSVPPLGWACAGAFLPALTALFTRIRLPRMLRAGMVAAGVLCCAPPVLFSLQTLALIVTREALQPVFTGLQYVIRSTSSMDLFFRYLPFAGGILLYLGCAGSSSRSL